MTTKQKQVDLKRRNTHLEINGIGATMENERTTKRTWNEDRREPADRGHGQRRAAPRERQVRMNGSCASRGQMRRAEPIENAFIPGLEHRLRLADILQPHSQPGDGAKFRRRIELHQLPPAAQCLGGLPAASSPVMSHISCSRWNADAPPPALPLISALLSSSSASLASSLSRRPRSSPM